MEIDDADVQIWAVGGKTRTKKPPTKIHSYGLYGYNPQNSLKARKESINVAVRNIGIVDTYKRLYVMKHFEGSGANIEADITDLKKKLRKQTGGKGRSDSVSVSDSDTDDVEFEQVDLKINPKYRCKETEI